MATKTQIANLALIRMGVSEQLSDVDTDTTRNALTLALLFNHERDFVLRDFPWPWATKYATLGLIDGNAVTANRADEANNDWRYAYRYPSDCLYARRLVTSAGRDNPDPPPFRVGRDYSWENDTDETVTLSTGAGWTTADTITVTASDDMFAEDDVGSKIRVTSGADEVTITIVTFTSATVVSGTPDQTVPASLRSAARDTWFLEYDGRILWTDEEDGVLEYTVAITDTAEFDSLFVSMLAWRLAAAAALSLSRLPKLADEARQMYALEKSQAERAALNEGQKDFPLDAEWIRER